MEGSRYFKYDLISSKQNEKMKNYNGLEICLRVKYRTTEIDLVNNFFLQSTIIRVSRTRVNKLEFNDEKKK